VWAAQDGTVANGFASARGHDFQLQLFPVKSIDTGMEPIFSEYRVIAKLLSKPFLNGAFRKKLIMILKPFLMRTA
jgi:hypothetical protein